MESEGRGHRSDEPREGPALGSLIDGGDAMACAAWLDATAARDTVYTLSHLSDVQRERLLALLRPEAAADVIDHLPEAQAVDALESLAPDTAARIIEELPSDEQTDLINELDSAEAEAILDALDPEDAADVRRLSAYDDDVAGGLMMAEFMAFRPEATVREALSDLETNAERYSTIHVQYSYVVDAEHRLKGVVPVRRLLLAPRTQRLDEIMLQDPVTVLDTIGLDELAHAFSEHSYRGLPVIDGAGRLVGVIERNDVEDAVVESTESLYRHTQGIVGGEELRTMPLMVRSGRRLAWLSINIVLNVLAASIIAMYQDTLEAVIALAVFLPIISDMSGCSGNQAVAVSMRELTLGVTRPKDIATVLGKEISIGLLNGLVLGLLIALVAVAWQGNPYLGAVVGSALMLNTVIAVSIGGSIPLVLRGFGLDPALASGPVLTTITDMCGFLLVLSLATAAMGKIQAF